jgi:hypothetical protein
VWQAGGRTSSTKASFTWSEGYFLLQVNSLEEALAIARQYPGLPYGAKMKVRPVAGECPLVEVRVLRKESINLANSKQTTVNKRLVPQSRDQPKKGKT